jgi:hypothetical protein
VLGESRHRHARRPPVPAVDDVGGHVEAQLELALVERGARHQLLGLDIHVSTIGDQRCEQLLGSLVLAAQLGHRRQPVPGERRLGAWTRPAQRKGTLVVLGDLCAVPAARSDERRAKGQPDAQLGLVSIGAGRQVVEVIERVEKRGRRRCEGAPTFGPLTDDAQVLDRASMIAARHEVLGEPAGDVVGTAGVTQLEGAADGSVGGDGPVDGEPLVQNLPEQVVSELESRRRGAVRPLGASHRLDLVESPCHRGQLGVDILDRFAERRSDACGVELATDDRSHLEYMGCAIIELGEVAIDQLAEVVRHKCLELVRWQSEVHSVPVDGEVPESPPSAHHLEREQRNPVTAPADDEEQGVGNVGAVESVDDEPIQLGRGQTAQLDVDRLAGPGAGEDKIERRSRLVTNAGDDEELTRLRALEHEVEHVECALVGPVEVFENERDRRDAGKLFE